MNTLSEIRPGSYYDSVVLMQLQKKLAALPGIEDAGVIMATPANKVLLTEFDLLTDEGNEAGPDDLLIVIKSNNKQTAKDAISKVDEILKKRRSMISKGFRPHSLVSALDQFPDANWVLVSPMRNGSEPLSSVPTFSPIGART